MGENELRQFASELIAFTSQFSDEHWSAKHILGAPKSQGVYGDSPLAWSPLAYDAEQSIEVAFETAVYIRQVRIYENFNGGSVVKIEARHSLDSYRTLWSSEKPCDVFAYRIFAPELRVDWADAPFRSDRIRLTLSQHERSLFAEIEAVELVGAVLDTDVCAASIGRHLLDMLNEPCPFADMYIRIDRHQFKAHRNIVAARSRKLYDFMMFAVADESPTSPPLEMVLVVNSPMPLTSFEFRLLLEFIYSDELNERRLDQWMHLHDVYGREAAAATYLVTSRLMRVAIQFDMKRFEDLLLRYMIARLLRLDTVVQILCDALDYGASGDHSEDDSDDSIDNDVFNEESPTDTAAAEYVLQRVKHACHEFILCHFREIFQLSSIRLLRKRDLLEIIYYWNDNSNINNC